MSESVSEELHRVIIWSLSVFTNSLWRVNRVYVVTAAMIADQKRGFTCLVRYLIIVSGTHGIAKMLIEVYLLCVYISR